MRASFQNVLGWAIAIPVLMAAPADAQTMGMDLAKFLETPAVSGYEQLLAQEVRERLKAFRPQTDSIGNVWITFGTGSPHRLIVTPLDQPGYLVSGITDDGYLRVQRLPQQAPHGLFDQLHAAQPVVVVTRRGTRVPGVVAGLSTHLQGGRRDPPRVSHPDEMYVDIGAASLAEVHRAGVDLLDPISLDLKAYLLDMRKLTAPAAGDRFGVAALTELARRVDASRLQGTLTLAFVVQQWANSRGLDRLTQHLRTDEMIYVGRLLPRRGGAGQQAEAQVRAPSKEPGSGVLIATENPDAVPAGLADELLSLARKENIPAATDYSAPLPRASYTQGPSLPAGLAHVGIATALPVTPAEIMDCADLESLVKLLAAYVGGRREGRGTGFEIREDKEQPRAARAPSVREILARLVETYGVSGAEAPVREAIEQLLPAWAKPESDDAGNLILRLPAARTARNPKRILFVAHMDEIGYVVRSIADDGRLVVQSRGGRIPEFFLGHAVKVHRAKGEPVHGVLELPTGWDRPDFQWARGPQAGPTRVDIGARSAAEVRERNVQPGDTVTVPKKYRPLLGTRANGPSFDDRVGSTALVAATWSLGATPQGQAMPRELPAEVIFVWSTAEEIGLVGAKAVADRLAANGQTPDFVFPVDTFVSSDSPLELSRFANARIGQGFVVRAVDNSNILPRDVVDRVVRLARAHNIPVQFGVTGGGNDGAVFLRHGAINVPIGWPLRYSHSPGEVIDLRDAEALARIVAVIARFWHAPAGQSR